MLQAAGTSPKYSTNEPTEYFVSSTLKHLYIGGDVSSFCIAVPRAIGADVWVLRKRAEHLHNGTTTL